MREFVRVFRRRPSHVDGHNHIHVIPQIAEIISPIMSEYGIYLTRLPMHPLRTHNDINALFV